jgi:site-specific DNA-adenine methylase
MKMLSSLKWFGGQFGNLGFIQPFMAVPHAISVDAFCGSGALTLNKPKAKVEFMLDTDGRVATTLKVIRDNVEELAEQLWLTPWSEQEYLLAISDHPHESDMEVARRFCFACTASIRGGSRFTPGDFRTQKNPHGRYTTATGDMDNLISRLYGISGRLRSVQIIMDDALGFLTKPAMKNGKRIIDMEDGLIMADPPWMKHTRKQKKGYEHETEDDEKFHRNLFDVLDAAAGYAFVLGNNSDLYEEMYVSAGWTRYDSTYQTNSGGESTVSLWANPKLASVPRNEQLDIEMWQPTTPAAGVGWILKEKSQ